LSKSRVEWSKKKKKKKTNLRRGCIKPEKTTTTKWVGGSQRLQVGGGLDGVQNANKWDLHVG